MRRLTRNKLKKLKKRLNEIKAGQVSMTGSFCSALKNAKTLSTSRVIVCAPKKKDYSVTTDLTAEYKEKYSSGYTATKAEIKTGEVTARDIEKIGYYAIPKKRKQTN